MPVAGKVIIGMIKTGTPGFITNVASETGDTHTSTNDP